MPALPTGDPAPDTGELPDAALATLTQRQFGMYVHVPFCARRCGYCDFNTYTATELGAASPDGLMSSYADAAASEMALAAQVLGADDRAALPAVETIFFGGGTPTLLPVEDLTRLVARIDDTFGLAPDAEITVEANPDSVTAPQLDALAAGGVTRISIGMQSAVPSVLATLDRTHDPEAVARAVEAARYAGLQVSLDVIYGTPGESLRQWQATLKHVVAMAPDHVSAYALTVEPGTALFNAVRRGELPPPGDDDEAAKYEWADEFLAEHDYRWYEISNFARAERFRCRHNELYWRGDNWWGIGPGAHSHVGGVRWWNVKHPRSYQAALTEGRSPAAGRETLTPQQQRDEEIMLRIRLREGLPAGPWGEPEAIAGLIADGLIDGASALNQQLVLTRRGRLLADTVVHRVLAVG